ncbi:MAG: hypothetical protein ACHRXM_09880, partial [Isosphaerales bacterium]
PGGGGVVLVAQAVQVGAAVQVAPGSDGGGNLSLTTVALAARGLLAARGAPAAKVAMVAPAALVPAGVCLSRREISCS